MLHAIMRLGLAKLLVIATMGSSLAACHGEVDPGRHPEDLQSFSYSWFTPFHQGRTFQLDRTCRVVVSNLNFAGKTYGEGTAPADACRALATFVTSSDVMRALAAPSDHCPSGTDSFAQFGVTLVDGESFTRSVCGPSGYEAVFQSVTQEMDLVEDAYTHAVDADAGDTSDAGD